MSRVKWFLLLIPLAALAQVGLRDPAYIAASVQASAPVTPQSFSNIFVWWKSDATGSNYSDGQTVDLWTNSSSVGVYKLKSTVDTGRAKFSNNWFGSYPAVCFDGVNDAYAITNDAIQNSYRTLSVLRPYTFVVIGRATTSGGIPIFSTDNLNQICGLGISATNWMRSYQDPTYPTINLGIAFTNKFMTVFQGRSSPAENRFWNDLNTGTNLTTSFDLYFDNIGGLIPSSFYKWELAEVIVFTNHYLTGLEITNLYNNYAKPRYGLP